MSVFGIDSVTLASWVQAIGSIAAIGASVYIVNRQHRLEIISEEERKRRESDERAARMLDLIAHASNDVHALRENRDDPKALATHWREKSGNNVRLQLAQIQFDLDQLSSIPWMDVSNAMTLYEVTYALMVAKSALELEINNYPATEEVFQRVSKAVETPDVLRSATRALLRSVAIKKSAQARETLPREESVRSAVVKGP